MLLVRKSENVKCSHSPEPWSLQLNQTIQFSVNLKGSLEHLFPFPQRVESTSGDMSPFKFSQILLPCPDKVVSVMGVWLNSVSKRDICERQVKEVELNYSIITQSTNRILTFYLQLGYAKHFTQTQHENDFLYYFNHETLSCQRRGVDVHLIQASAAASDEVVNDIT